MLFITLLIKPDLGDKLNPLRTKYISLSGIQVQHFTLKTNRIQTIYQQLLIMMFFHYPPQ